jgi:hypothetical protein
MVEITITHKKKSPKNFHNVEVLDFDRSMKNDANMTLPL